MANPTKPFQNQNSPTVIARRSRSNPALLLTLLLFSTLAFASHTNHQKKLEAVNKKIKKIKISLHQHQKKHTQLQHSLKENEIKIGKLSFDIRKIQPELIRHKKILHQLILKQDQLQKKLNYNRRSLNRQTVSAYKLSQTSTLELILAQQDPEKLNRMLTYYQYFAQHRMELIKKIKYNIGILHANQTKINAQTITLLKIKKSLLNKRHELQSIQTQRTLILKQIDSTISRNRNTLLHLSSDKKQLEHILHQIKMAKNMRVPEGIPFSKLRGKLSWPTQGHIENHFGQPIQNSEITWNGILIKTRRGKPVYAIAPGKVVFAKWLAGYGLLTIVNHGHGYMTLYGRNNSLLKSEGESVIAGEAIATVGQSGGYTQTALYFAIRHDGKPINPATWCK